MKNIFNFVLSVVLLISLSACNLGTQQSAETDEVVITEVAPATAAATPTEVVPTPVEHKTIPGEFPAEPSGVVGDQDSSVTAEKNRAPGGDRFTFTRFERPFNSEAMDEYYPHLDIQEGYLFMDETWIYVSISLKSNEASKELKGKYGFELDTDVDGGGDWLILASNPVSTEWTTAGVEVWFDTNDDVGGDVPTTTDSNPIVEDGYETLAFGADAGDDPDLAWARVSPNDPNIVHLAVKTDILGKSERFLAGLWAGDEDLNPALFEFSDTFTHEQAGAAMTELEYFYPIKELSALDNTCRMAVGFQPTGKEAGLCPIPPPPGQVEEQPVDSGCPAQYLVCRNVSMIAVVIVCVCNQP